jgi:hypothetical protein
MISDFPHARDKDLVVKSLGDEILIYDLKRHKAHSLNQTAAWVWKHADGHTPAEEMCIRLGEELKTPVHEKVVWIALEHLHKAHLLKETAPWIPSGVHLSRRDAVRTLGMAAVLVPAVTTIVAPLAAAVASCKPKGVGCRNNNECCSRVCGANGKCQ